MLINAVCKECSVTKKAVEYYIEQGLVSPTVQENGYRDFSEEDICRLKKISILRNLGLSVTDIQDVLSGETAASVLNEIYHRRTLQMTVLQEKQKLIQELASTHDWEQVQDRLCQLQKEQTILERLMNAFPGYYGKLLCLHFAPYLNEPVLTDRQQEAYDTIVSFLDKVDFNIPTDLREYLDEITITLDESFMERLTRSTSAAIHEAEKHLSSNKEIMESWNTEDGREASWAMNDHCVVLIGYSADSVTVADPIEGIVSYDRAQFESAFRSRGTQCVILKNVQ